MTSEPLDAQVLAIVYAAALASPVNLKPSERLRFARTAVDDFDAMLASRQPEQPK